ncbi:MAG: hypothetical protein KC619_27765 [Myxococcales bacterium]|nr:hypothetical protein [Myxococcales bacterium]
MPKRPAPPTGALRDERSRDPLEEEEERRSGRCDGASYRGAGSARTLGDR